MVYFILPFLVSWDRNFGYWFLILPFFSYKFPCQHCFSCIPYVFFLCFYFHFFVQFLFPWRHPLWHLNYLGVPNFQVFRDFLVLFFLLLITSLILYDQSMLRMITILSNLLYFCFISLNIVYFGNCYVDAIVG